jgi:protein-tyrosine phosphatase
MIDLHSHILPALCDGSQDVETSIAMAEIAVEDGTEILACTPHIYPGVYENKKSDISAALKCLQGILDERSIPLKLVIGADVHMVPEVKEGLESGRIPTLNDSRYFLLEPSHHVPVPQFVDNVTNYVRSGYVPIITHPERLSWIDAYYADFVEVVEQGAWLQITSGAIVGRFGRKAKMFSERLLKDGIVHVIATDAHGVRNRPPLLKEGMEAAVGIVGQSEAWRMVYERPLGVINNMSPADLPGAMRFAGSMVSDEEKKQGKGNFLKRFFLR